MAEKLVPWWCVPLLGGLAAALGCAELHESPGDVQGSVRNDPLEDDCSQLDVEECSRVPTCEVRDGILLDTEHRCIGDRQPSGCSKKLEEPRSCGDAETYARDAQGRVWLFGDTCTPESLQRVSIRTGSPEADWLTWNACATECVGGTCRPRPLCSSSSQCEDGEYCTTEEGECRSGCSDPTQVYPAVCVGICKPRPLCSSSSQCEGSELPPASKVACADVSPDACAHREDCLPIRAQAYDVTRQCWPGWKNVGCMEKTQGCTSAITYARDAEERTWRFTSGCIPKGWQAFLPNVQPQQSWPACSF